MFDPETTSVSHVPIGETSGEYPKQQKEVPGLAKSSSSKSDSADIYLEVEGGQEVFFRGSYVTRVPLRGADVIVGRRDVMAGHYPDIDLAMYRKQDPSISRRHLRIYHDVNNTWFVEDLCNHNATFLNSYDAPLNHERRELKSGDRIIVSSSIALVFKLVK